MVFVLASCANYSFQKKRYSKGFYVTKTHSKSSKVKTEPLADEVKSETTKNKSTDFEASLPDLSEPIDQLTWVNAHQHIENKNSEKNGLKSKTPDNLSLIPITFNGFNSIITDNKILKQSSSASVFQKRNDFFSFWDNVVTGYYILATIIVIVVLVYYLFTVFPIATALLYAAVILGVLLVLAGIDMLANNQF